MKLFLICLTLLGYFEIHAAELVLFGTYQGKNLYVQNPLLADGKNYSSSEVYLNEDFLMYAPKASAFVIDLSHLALNQKVEIKIIHDGAKPPKFVNAHAIRNYIIHQDASYAPIVDVFRWTKAENDTLRWSVYGQKPEGMFIVQRAKDVDWENIDSLQINATTIYRFPVKHRPGKNSYRIKLIDMDGYVSWSNLFDYYSEEQSKQFYPAESKPEFDRLTGVSYFPKKAKRAIRLSKEAPYEIWLKDKKLFEGYGILIDIKDLAPDEYFIKIGEHQGSFVKY